MSRIRLVASSVANVIKINPKFYHPATHGVTFSLLAKWKSCRVRALLHLLGWTPRKVAVYSIFGTICHAILESAYGDMQSGKLTSIPADSYIKKHVRRIEREWKAENPKADRETLQKLEMVCLFAETVMPIYFRYWHKDFTQFKWARVEGEFKRPFSIGGFKTFLRGKMDGTLRVAGSKGRWLFETKTKSRLGEHGETNLVDILPYELQVTFYLVTMWIQDDQIPGGLIYNIIRRPGLEMRKSENPAQFRARLEADIAKRPAFYFIRLRMQVDRTDLEKQVRNQDAIVHDFLRWFHGEAPHYPNSDMCENKYGTCEFLAICARQDYTGFYKRPTVFRELEDM